ncbi:unnamed protein product [Pleuronectes platessa]|uniref:Uncharacterized protein n=1 Tax=Pleuronectes platessa TaxID=8262 RepID=A0A9N7U5Z5_PLEPL|nr:unnamed protein product [Pleuronectes platessa]
MSVLVLKPQNYMRTGLGPEGRHRHSVVNTQKGLCFDQWAAWLASRSACVGLVIERCERRVQAESEERAGWRLGTKKEAKSVQAQGYTTDMLASTEKKLSNPAMMSEPEDFTSTVIISLTTGHKNTMISVSTISSTVIPVDASGLFPVDAVTCFGLGASGKEVDGLSIRRQRKPTGHNMTGLKPFSGVVSFTSASYLPWPAKSHQPARCALPSACPPLNNRPGLERIQLQMAAPARSPSRFPPTSRVPCLCQL